MQSCCAKKIREYKGMDVHETLRLLPVRDEQSNLKAYLCPITCRMMEDYPICVEVLSKWRKDNPTVSNNCFAVTNQRTKEWVFNVVLADEKKILFLILDTHGSMIGQMGLCNIADQDKCADIYAVIKGKKDAEKGIMELALKTLLRWANSELDIQKFFLTTQQDNLRAIGLYQKVGFCVIRNIPLKKMQLENEVKWVETEELVPEKYDVRMEYKGKL